MINQLRYFEGAKPGLKPKRPLSQVEETNQKKQKCKDYESKRERPLLDSWKTGRPWLQFNTANKSMTCSVCTDFYTDRQPGGINPNLKGQHTFITGCTNRKISAVIDHEKSKYHEDAVKKTAAKEQSSSEVMNESAAGKTFNMLHQANRHRIAVLFRNAHAVIKQNKALTDYKWLCDLDRAKGVDVGNTYLNEKAALNFVNIIAGTEKEKTTNLVNDAKFFSFLMDGSTDITGDEQEAIYIRVANQGKVTERFLNIGTPESTRSRDLFDFVCQSLESFDIDKAKLIGMGSDGASNMTGVRSGLSALLKQEVGKEIINVHCLAHRLELSFRDIVKTSKLYDKLMTLLIGLHYFYIKQYKNKSGLQRAMEALKINGVLPPKVTGTRWLPHVYRGITSLLRTYKAYEAHLATSSHGNPKAEGLLKIMKDKSLMAFTLFLHDVLDPLMKLSLKLQKDGNTIADSLFWVEATVELLQQCKNRDSKQVSDLIESGQYEGIALRGQPPSMTYKNDMIDGFCDAINKRFQLEERHIINATRILNFKNWPSAKSDELQDFGVEEVKDVAGHFKTTLQRSEFEDEDVLNEWRMLKIVLHKRHGTELQKKSWSDVYDADDEFKNINLIIDLLLTLPPTSVSCETTFSQMKLIKTSRRTRLSSKTLNSLLLVKLESASVDNFEPDMAIDRWFASAVRPRRLTYQRKAKVATMAADDVVDLVDVSADGIEAEVTATDEAEVTATVEAEVTATDEAEVTATAEAEVTATAEAEVTATDEAEVTATEEHYDQQLQLDIEFLNSICDVDDNDSFCMDFQDMEGNFMNILEYSRSA